MSARRTHLTRIAHEALAIEQEEAQKAGTLGYMARVLVQTTMPHRDPHATVFKRRNGNFRLAMIAADGLPYGRYPRLLLAWVTTEATRTKTPRLDLGPSLSAFMGELGMVPTGGRWGTIGRLRLQVRRLFSSAISCTLDDPAAGTYQERGFRVAAETALWWDPKSPDQAALFGSYVELTEPFFRSITTRPVPIDLRALRTLRSPFALDIYTWLTYRNSYLRRDVEIPWEALTLQFGSDYKRLRAFKAAFLKHLRTVLTVYPDARVAGGKSGLLLKPSPTHVRRLKRAAE